jgi:hypothetical protein
MGCLQPDADFLLHSLLTEKGRTLLAASEQFEPTARENLVKLHHTKIAAM